MRRGVDVEHCRATSCRCCRHRGCRPATTIFLLILLRSQSPISSCHSFRGPYEKRIALLRAIPRAEWRCSIALFSISSTYRSWHHRPEHILETTGSFHAEKCTACVLINLLSQPPGPIPKKNHASPRPCPGVSCAPAVRARSVLPTLSVVSLLVRPKISVLVMRTCLLISHAQRYNLKSLSCTLYLLTTSYFPPSVLMPKATSPNVTPSKKRRCPVCHIKYHIRGFASHVKKCQRENEERQGDKRYMKELKKLRRRAATRSEVDTGMSTGTRLIIYFNCVFTTASSYQSLSYVTADVDQTPSDAGLGPLDGAHGLILPRN